jgi:hypothetical protein
METINVNIKALFGDKVMVKNYRAKGDLWETGEVISVKCFIRKDKTYRMQYRVVLERRAKKGCVFLTVGDDKINKL